jgi:amino acid transporter
MADRGILPRVLGHRSKHGTPTYGILMSASGVMCLCWMSFAEVIDMLNVLYCFAQLIEFAAFVQLRIKHPDLPRPFKIPLGTVGVSIMLLGPTFFCVVIIAISSTKTLVTIFCITLMGFVFQFILHVGRVKGWFIFHNIYFSEGGVTALRLAQERYEYESIPELELPSAARSISEGAL